MTNIWEFLLMTLTASLAAGLLLILKKVLSDKLSPRWQYGIWSLLALRILLPVAVSGRYILLPLPQWIEFLKFMAERNLTSAYSAAFEPITAPWFAPVISGSPVSITDWLFIIYTAGVAVTLAAYCLSYVRLRIMLTKGTPTDAQTQSLIAQTCSGLGLRRCRSVEIEGLTSAFVCGIFRPLLALPKGAVTDEKIILHELLHLKYKDALQSIFWTVLRCINWCNPFLQYVFNRISNDMESLCDQRVLERIEGEERRDYGTILLSMVNEKYPRAFGTTSLSNGGKNIARRIQCIAQFKKYPKGMALVSVCIAVMLIQPLFIGTTAYGLQNADLSPATNSDTNLYSNMAALRLSRCTTIAGAIDTYAKGLIAENGLYIAAASPLAAQEDLMNQMLASKADGWIYTHLENGLNGEPAQQSSEFATPFSNGHYSVFNLTRSGEDGRTYTCRLAVYLEFCQRTEEEIAAGEDVYYTDPETGGWLPAFAFYDLTLRAEGSHWVIADCSQPDVIIAENLNYVSNEHLYRNLSPVALYEGTGIHGSITAPLYTEFFIQQPESGQQNSGFSFWGGDGFSTVPQPEARFSKADMSFLVTYTYSGDEALENIYYVTLESLICDEEADIPEPGQRFEDNSGPGINQSGGGSSSSGWAYIAEAFKDGDFWDGTITDRNANKYFTYETELLDYFRADNLPDLPVPAAIVSKCYMPGHETDFIISREVN